MHGLDADVRLRRMRISLQGARMVRTVRTTPLLPSQSVVRLGLRVGLKREKIRWFVFLSSPLNRNDKCRECDFAMKALCSI